MSVEPTKEELSSDLGSSPKANIQALYNSPTANEFDINPPVKLDLDQAKLLILSQQAESQSPLPSNSNKKDNLNPETFLPSLLNSLYTNAVNHENTIINNNFQSNFVNLNALDRDFNFQTNNNLMEPLEQQHNYINTDELMNKTLALISEDINKSRNVPNSPVENTKSILESLSHKSSLDNMSDLPMEQRNRLRRSPVYAYFTFLSETGEGVGYRCKLCGHTYQSFSSTTTFFKHLRRKHKIDLREAKKSNTNNNDNNNIYDMPNLNIKQEHYNNIINNPTFQQFEQSIEELNEMLTSYPIGDDEQICKNSLSKLSEQLISGPLVTQSKEIAEKYYSMLNQTFPINPNLDLNNIFLNSLGKERAHLLDDPMFIKFIKEINPNVVLPSSKQVLNDENT